MFCRSALPAGTSEGAGSTRVRKARTTRAPPAPAITSAIVPRRRLVAISSSALMCSRYGARARTELVERALSGRAVPVVTALLAVVLLPGRRRRSGGPRRGDGDRPVRVRPGALVVHDPHGHVVHAAAEGVHERRRAVRVS